MSLTPEQQALLQSEIVGTPELTGASKEIIMSHLNRDGSALTETWTRIPLEDQKIKLSRLALLTYLTAEQRAGLREMMASEAGADLAMLYNADNEYWINDLTFRGMLDALGSALGIDAGVIDAIKRLGERQISRAEELFGRKLVIGDFE